MRNPLDYSMPDRPDQMRRGTDLTYYEAVAQAVELRNGMPVAVLDEELARPTRSYKQKGNTSRNGSKRASSTPAKMRRIFWTALTKVFELKNWLRQRESPVANPAFLARLRHVPACAGGASPSIAQELNLSVKTIDEDGAVID